MILIIPDGHYYWVGGPPKVFLLSSPDPVTPNPNLDLLSRSEPPTPSELRSKFHKGDCIGDCRGEYCRSVGVIKI